MNSMKQNSTDHNYQLLMQLQTEAKGNSKGSQNQSKVFRGEQIFGTKENSLLTQTLPHPKGKYVSNEDQYRLLIENKNKVSGRIPEMILNMVPPNEAMINSNLQSPKSLT